MTSRNPDASVNPAGEWEEPGGAAKLPSVSSLFHVLWLRKWPALITWLILSIPVGVALSIFDLPRSYTASTVMRFPQVVGAQTNVMRDVAITEGESIISILNSFQVLDAAIRKLGLRMRITTPDLFYRDVFEILEYGESLGSGKYVITISNGGLHADVQYTPLNSATAYSIFDGSLPRDGRLSLQGLDIRFTRGFLSGAKGRKVELDMVAFEDAFRDLKKSIAARSMGGGNFEMRLKDRDPWMVAEILMVVQSKFLDVYYGTTEVQDVGILAQMEKDVALAKERLEKSQDELSKYYASNPELSVKDVGTGRDNLGYLEARMQVESADQRRKRVQQAFGARDAAAATPEKDFFWAIELLRAMAEAGEAKANIMRASLEEMTARQAEYKRTLSPEHPKILEVEAERQTLYRQIEETEAALVRRLDADLQELRVRMANSAPRGPAHTTVKVQLELERLNNVNHNNQNIYDRLLESYNRAKLVTGSEFFKVTVVDPARPAIYKPPSMKTRLAIAAASVLFLLIAIPGLFLAWGLLFIRIWTKGDVKRLLNLKTLGVLSLRKPKKSAEAKGENREAEDLKGQRSVDPMLLVHGRDTTLEDVEVFRTIREEVENLMRNPAAPGRFCIMVASCRPHEGKSTCASNLAVTFARKGKRTLLVDADFRLGRIANIFNLTVATGIDTILDQPDISTELFLDSATLAYQPTIQRNLVVAPRKSQKANASELVSSDRFKEFIRLARDQFEVVIIDTPPVRITPDPLSLADLADGVIFVCRSGLTPASEAREAVETLLERNPRVYAILNGMKGSPFEESRYRKYSYYYQVQADPGEQGG